MTSWTDTPDYGPPPGSISPPPSPLDPGWANWIRAEAEAKRDQAFPGSPKEYSISLRVEVVGTRRIATEGEMPGPWEAEPVTMKTRPPAEYRDFTRFRRKYPRLTITEYDVVHVTLVITFPDPDGGRYERTYYFWRPKGSTSFDNAMVYRWRWTSGLKKIGDIEVEWYDASNIPYLDEIMRPGNEDGLLEPPDNPPESLLIGMSPEPSAGGQQSAWAMVKPKTLFAFMSVPAVSDVELSAAVRK